MVEGLSGAERVSTQDALRQCERFAAAPRRRECALEELIHPRITVYTPKNTRHQRLLWAQSSSPKNDPLIQLYPRSRNQAGLRSPRRPLGATRKLSEFSNTSTATFPRY